MRVKDSNKNWIREKKKYDNQVKFLNNQEMFHNNDFTISEFSNNLLKEEIKIFGEIFEDI